MPIVDIITMAATGSEYDMGGVISRTETNDKLAYFSKLVFPAVSFIDPTYTFTLPVKQTSAAISDEYTFSILVHYACEFFAYYTPAEDEACGCLIIKIDHSSLI